jgi:hypothetical protein
MMTNRGLLIASGALLLFLANGALADVLDPVLCSEAAGGATTTVGLTNNQKSKFNLTGGGCVARIDNINIYVASDGEAFFDPFKTGFDTSDGVIVPKTWTLVAGTGKGWKMVKSPFGVFSQAWVFPETLPGKAEPAIAFTKPSKFPKPSLGLYTIKESASRGATSDLARVENIGNKGQVTFQSLPEGGIPLELALGPCSVLLCGILLRKRLVLS